MPPIENKPGNTHLPPNLYPKISRQLLEVILSVLPEASYSEN